MKKGWNGSCGDVTPNTEVKRQCSPRWVLILVCTLVVLGGMWALFQTMSSPKSIEEPRKSRDIPEVSPRERMKMIVEARTGRELREDRAAPLAKKAAEPEFYTNKAGIVRRRTGKAFVLRAPPATPIFSNSAERQLDLVLNLPIGEGFFDYDVPENFEDEFAYSLTNQIVIAEDDPPDVVRRKERVIEAKETLSKYAKEKGSAAEALKQAKLELKEKYDDYRFFVKGLDELRANDATAEEISEYAVAAKKMMDERSMEVSLPLNEEEVEIAKEIENLINPKEEATVNEN